ncbi:7725_t:CDS:2 [Dentiscutata heterogama]|uniref:7725_t:CDS:1 n=1 Tax=Dentiscutata heterogama TaxID=1316150 RepID=A0ACA9M8C1_9GLOM|nr:7725_t:CDS:2 [Dentiscutata heterogama]
MSATNDMDSFQERKYTLFKLKTTFKKLESLKSMTFRRSIICAFIWAVSLALGIFLLITKENNMNIKSIISTFLLGAGSIGTLVSSFLSFIKLFPIKKLDTKENFDDTLVKISVHEYKVDSCETVLDSKQLEFIAKYSAEGLCKKISNEIMEKMSPFGLALNFLEKLINNLRWMNILQIIYISIMATVILVFSIISIFFIYNDSGIEVVNNGVRIVNVLSLHQFP